MPWFSPQIQGLAMRKWMNMSAPPVHLRIVFRDVYRQFDELPGRGAGTWSAWQWSVVATHADRKELFLQAGRAVVDLARRYYEQDDATALPRGIATFEAFENAMTLDIAMADQRIQFCIYWPRLKRVKCRSRWPISTDSRAVSESVQGGSVRAYRASRRCASCRRNLRHTR